MVHSRTTTAVKTALIACILTALGLSGCSAQPASESSVSAGTAEHTTLRLATIGLTSDGSIMLGIEKGFFADEGLDIETSIVANPAAGLAAAQSGQVDLAYAPIIPALNAMAQQIPLKIVAGAEGYPDDAVDADKYDHDELFASAESGIRSIDELAGKTIAVPARKALMEVVITTTLTENGVDPSSVNWVVLDFASAVAALKNGTVDAAGLGSQFSAQAEADGASKLGPLGIEFFERGAVGVWVAGASTVESKPEAMQAFERAVQKSSDYANEHPEEAVQAGLDYTNSPLAVSDVRVPFWTPLVRQADVERAAKKLVDLGFLTTLVPLDGVVIGDQ